MRPRCCAARIREGGKVKTETLANLSHLPAETIDAGPRVAGRQDPCAGRRGVRDRAVAAARARGRGVGHGRQARAWPSCWARPARSGTWRSRWSSPGRCQPASKLATTRWWARPRLAADLGVGGASTDDVYAAMDWLVGARPRSRRAWPAATSSRGGGCCTTCRHRGWKGPLPPGRPRATPVMARPARTRSSTG